MMYGKAALALLSVLASETSVSSVAAAKHRRTRRGKRSVVNLRRQLDETHVCADGTTPAIPICKIRLDQSGNGADYVTEYLCVGDEIPTGNGQWDAPIDGACDSQAVPCSTICADPDATPYCVDGKCSATATTPSTESAGTGATGSGGGGSGGGGSGGGGSGGGGDAENTATVLYCHIDGHRHGFKLKTKEQVSENVGACTCDLCPDGYICEEDIDDVDGDNFDCFAPAAAPEDTGGGPEDVSVGSAEPPEVCKANGNSGKYSDLVEGGCLSDLSWWCPDGKPTEHPYEEEDSLTTPDPTLKKWVCVPPAPAGQEDAPAGTETAEPVRMCRVFYEKDGTTVRKFKDIEGRRLHAAHQDLNGNHKDLPGYCDFYCVTDVLCGGTDEACAEKIIIEDGVEVVEGVCETLPPAETVDIVLEGGDQGGDDQGDQGGDDQGDQGGDDQGDQGGDDQGDQGGDGESSAAAAVTVKSKIIGGGKKCKEEATDKTGGYLDGGCLSNAGVWCPDGTPVQTGGEYECGNGQEKGKKRMLRM